jgi:hypothetical protein
MGNQLIPPAGLEPYLDAVTNALIWGDLELRELPSPVRDLYVLGECAGRSQVAYWQHLTNVYYEKWLNPERDQKLARGLVGAFEWRVRNGAL